MTKIIETQEVVREVVETETGFICDICSSENFHEQVEGGIHIDYSFGYGTIHDMTSVKADICDACFFDLIKKNVPGAIFTNHL